MYVQRRNASRGASSNPLERSCLRLRQRYEPLQFRLS